MEELLCRAIRERRWLKFNYTATARPGERVVEPHMLADNQRYQLALSAWFLRGENESQEGEGWREYLFESITGVVLLDETFTGTRPHYNPTGGQIFHRVRCAL